MQSLVKSSEQSKDCPRDPRNREVVYPALDDPQIGNLETLINALGIVKAYINNLPAYRQGLTAMRGGLEVGMAHGYWLIGPLAKLGPLRDKDVANLAGLLSTVGLVIISTVAISVYAGSNLPNPHSTVTRPNPPDAYKSKV